MANYDDNLRRQYWQNDDEWNEGRNQNQNDPYRYFDTTGSEGNGYQNRRNYQPEGYQGSGSYNEVGNSHNYGYNDDLRYQQWQERHSGRKEKAGYGQGSNYGMDVNPGGYAHYDDRDSFGYTSNGNNYGNYGMQNQPTRHRKEQYGGYERTTQEDNWQQQAYSGYQPNRGYRSSQPGGHGATGSTYVDEGQQGSNYDQDRRLHYQSNQYQKDRDWWDRTRDQVSSWFGDKAAERRRRIDEIKEHHRGKGPSEYKRSESRIREDVCERLTDDEIVDATNITVQIQGDEVVLSGTVHTREEKRRAEDVVESVSGVRNVENRIRIDRFGDDTNYNR